MSKRIRIEEVYHQMRVKKMDSEAAFIAKMIGKLERAKRSVERLKRKLWLKNAEDKKNPIRKHTKKTAVKKGTK